MSCVTKPLATKKDHCEKFCKDRVVGSGACICLMNKFLTSIYDTSMKQGNLFCSVCHAEIFQIMVLHVVLLVSSESSGWVGVHQLGLRLFGAMLWKLLIIEPFFRWKLNKIEIETVLEFGGVLGVVGKPSMSQI